MACGTYLETEEGHLTATGASEPGAPRLGCGRQPEQQLSRTSSMRTAVFSIVALAASGVIGCAVDDPVSNSIGEAVLRGPGTRLALADHATFPWEKSCIFGQTGYLP